MAGRSTPCDWIAPDKPGNEGGGQKLQFRLLAQLSGIDMICPMNKLTERPLNESLSW
jgi:hypothetical protein